MSDSLSSVWGHSMHFANFPMLRFSKVYFSASFLPNSNKLHGKYMYGNQEAVTFLGNLPKFKRTFDLEKKLPQLHCHYPQSYVGFI